MAKLPLIKVTSTQGQRNGLAEEHPDHPGGAVDIYGDDVFTVAQTPEVNRRLRNGILKLVDGPKPDAAVEDKRVDDDPALAAAEQIANLKAAEAIAEIDACEDPAVLEALLAAESRSTVRKAAEERLEALTEPQA